MKLFAIFGDPVAHSRSPLMHNYVFSRLRFDACYTRIHLTDGSKLKETFFALGLSGANVTVPHKEAAFLACDEVRGFAKEIGVVNTLINENGKLIGYNTDADGFMFATKEFDNLKKILILGAGGTAKALFRRFLQEGLAVEVLNRSKGNLAYFKEFATPCHTWESFTPSSYDLVVNTTSAGLKDDHLPAPREIIENVLANTRYAADAIYGKVTPFLALACEKNIPAKDGADMLLGQGVLANDYFTQHRFDQERIKEAMAQSFLF